MNGHKKEHLIEAELLRVEDWQRFNNCEDFDHLIIIVI